MVSEKKLLPGGLSRHRRTRHLNDAMRGTTPSICVERARIYTESYQKSEGMPPILRRAQALKDLLENMTIFIEPDQLIVGNQASRPRSAPMYPEFGAFDQKELDLMPLRQVDRLQIDPADKQYLLTQVNPYWRGRSLSDLSRQYIDPDILTLLDSPCRVFDPLSRTRSGYGHYIPNIRRVLEGGFQGIASQAQGALDQLDRADPAQKGRRDFYRAALVVCQGVLAFQGRFARLARRMAREESDPRRARELELMAGVCDQVPYRPARNFWEALQSYWFTLLIDYLSQNGSAISGGRVDQLFYPYYQRDLEEGRITREEAGELLEALWVRHSQVIKACAFSSARNNGGFATTINVVLGGVDRQGRDAVNDLSYLCLEAEQHVFNSEPNTSIRLSPQNPDAFAARVIQILAEKEGGKLPLFNDQAVVRALTADGVALEDALDYAIVGCVEPTSQGDTMGRTNACFFNLAKCLELALFDGVCQMSGVRMGPATGAAFDRFEQVVRAYEAQVEYFAARMVSALNAIGKLHGEHGHIYTSLLIDGCLEKGLDCTCGGAKYDYVGVQGVGVADVADSLTAVKKLVFEEKRIAMADLLEGLRTNFAAQPLMRHILIHKAPKYGNDDGQADAMAAYVARQYCRCVTRYTTPQGGHYRAGLYCLSSNTPLGRQVCALPSGREAGTPLGDGGISPKHGMDVNGPTAAARSVAGLDHTLAANGVNFNLKFLPAILKTKADRDKLVRLIRSYFALGGMHIQFNVLSPETLLAAQKDPQAYRGLVVRVAGYSAFFVDLDRDIQNEIISRTQQNAI